MYPRLYVARELLREDGVIFISIDENEVAQLKLILNEIFGEENFIEEIIWKKRATPPNDRNIGRIHEYILCYAKQERSIKLGLLPRDKKSIDRYSNPDGDIRGAWVTSDLSANGKGGRISQSTIYPIINSKNNEEYLPSEGRCWLFNQEKMNRFIEEGRIGFRKKTGTPYLKRYLSEVRQGLTLPTILTEFGFSSTSASELDSLFIKKGLFEYAKPTTLLRVLINIGVVEKNDIILDFFAGSGTTAHAVMALNAEDQGNRKFITVQIDEKTDKKSEAYKAGYESIFDITKARIEKAQYTLESEALAPNKTRLKPSIPNLGFKIFETMPMFKGYLDNIEELSNNTTLFNGSELTNDELETLLTTWKVHDGMRLHESLESLNLGSYVAYTSKNTVYFMDKGFNLEALQAFVEKLDNDDSFEPSKLVLFGYNFDSKYQREFKEALANYSNKKSIELDIVVRY
jgi:adenine-specific DNA-methyltransferase